MVSTGADRSLSTHSARWLELKAEYLSYQQHLTSLRDSHDRSRKSASYRERQRRSPSPPRPSRADQRQQQERDDPSSSARKGKRASEGQGQPDRPPKKAKRGSSPSQPHPHARLGTPEPLDPSIAPDSEEALSARGAFPKGCILWVRNVHEKSTKTSLKGVMGRLLEEWEEGSGKGVEFVDYEKGLDVVSVHWLVFSRIQTHLFVLTVPSPLLLIPPRFGHAQALQRVVLRPSSA